MLTRRSTDALAIPLATILLSGLVSGALSGCGDDGGGGGDPDASRPDAMEAGIDGGGGVPDAGVDAATGIDRTIESIAGGRFAPFEGYQDIAGAAHLVRMAQALRAELYVEGLAAGTEYVAHVHALPCDENEAGGHYKHDPSITAEVEDNEIWLRFTTDADGRGRASTGQEGADRTARMDAQSIVIHDPAAGGAKMACANLFFDDSGVGIIEHQGAFLPYPDAPAGDANLGGSITMIVSPETGQTVITLDLEGLDPTATYLAYMHALPCGVNDAGGHYKRDTTITTEQEDNEIWPSLATQDAQTFPHVVRYDAQSVVLHRMQAGTPRAACADLSRVTSIPEYITEGAGTALPGVDPQYASLDARASLVRAKDGNTSTDLEVTGLPPSVTGFTAHVHAGTCALTPPGGPHYKRYPNLMDELEGNEIWLAFDSDATGDALGSDIVGMHLARPDAISVVLHEPGTGTALACIDLE